MQAFFTSAMGHDVLMNVFEDDIVFPIRADWVLFDFYLKQKQKFSVWIFTENTSFIHYHAEMWGRYSEINKFKISNLSKNNKNTL